MKKFLRFATLLLFLLPLSLRAQSTTELHTGWKCRNILEVEATAEALSQPAYDIDQWMPATVPGTVLTTLLNNQKIPDPFYGMNNERIPDIYDTGNEHYTYWFVKDFETRRPGRNEEVWIRFRGVNYSCEVYLNGQKLNAAPHKGMFLRQSYRVTDYLNRNGQNRLAVLVYPPDPPGNPNGGQGGDGVIGKHVAHQYVAGWDWIQPVRDRNTGIWDKVFLERTGSINIINPHIVTRVGGRRTPLDPHQPPASIRVSAELQNPTDKVISGTLSYRTEQYQSKMEVRIPANATVEVFFPEQRIEKPRLWWPNGYGPQHLYELQLEFHDERDQLSDREAFRYGIRELSQAWNPTTRSLEFSINGQRIFLKGGNWIISDAMLRFSEERYDAEVRFHRDMNLNLIRIWGGAITERPEFYQACDKYGILVWQDFWISGDCNGRWLDPRKKEDQWTRRKYPDDHELFLRSAVDQVKMIRNHPSLAIWCGGNEIGPPEAIVTVLKDTLASTLDGTRLFIESSTSGELYFNHKGGVGDGPYGIQDPVSFWRDQSWSFNPELGSVGTGDHNSLARFIPDTSMIVPGQYEDQEAENAGRWTGIEPVWRYHKYIGYGDFIEKYGGAGNVKAFAEIAQLINYNQYRALVEGFSAHMWEWYTGFNIWKTQNPWTALRGQMYDYYLDPNGALYGLKKGSEPLHIMYNPVDQMIMVVNNTFDYYRDVMVIGYTIDENGKTRGIYQQLADIEPSSIKNIQPVGRGVSERSKEKGTFLMLKVLRSPEEILTDNLYWFADSTGHFPFLENMPEAAIRGTARKTDAHQIEVSLSNAEEGAMAFFIRLSLVEVATGERILPSFYSDNYVSIEAGETKTISLDYPDGAELEKARVSIEGWNVPSREIAIE